MLLGFGEVERALSSLYGNLYAKKEYKMQEYTT
jgi:hypothetical protein